MARLEDIPQPTREAVFTAPCPTFETQPFVFGPPLAQRRVAIVSSAALIRRGDRPFAFGSAECRFLPASLPAADILALLWQNAFQRYAELSHIRQCGHRRCGQRMM
jgi:D-proline reductase (dithiol) PrdB